MILVAHLAPQSLYKYQQFTTESLANLVNRQIWFSSPLRFNDPFDCGESVNLLDCSESEAKEIFQQLKKNHPDAPFLGAGHADGNEVRLILNTVIGDAMQESLEKRSRKGVACFSEVVDHMLMWAHYANGHRGFCWSSVPLALLLMKPKWLPIRTSFLG